ncbi:MAG TPA: ribonuclease HII [Candidatus Saccharimonadales bacterium]|nr:ribonuclease HII [Candidatus Saccharimonadales bacterium]
MTIVGVDEVGRGAWAGPVVAGAVALAVPIPGLKDSKQLSKAQRETLAALIHQQALAVGLGWVAPAEVDNLGLTEAVRLAMQCALEQIAVAFDELVIDGNYNFFPQDPRAQAVIKADASVSAVSAASIVAKVARDRYMAELGSAYTVYEFAKHVGYGTALHRAKLVAYGVCDQHRLSYKPVRALLGTIQA